MTALIQLLSCPAGATRYGTASAAASLPVDLELSSVTDMVFVVQVHTDRPLVPRLSLELSGKLLDCEGVTDESRWRVSNAGSDGAEWLQLSEAPSAFWHASPAASDRNWSVPMRVEVLGAVGCRIAGTVTARVARSARAFEPLEEDLGVSLRWVSAGGTAP